jgi:hypothetical protein
MGVQRDRRHFDWDVRLSGSPLLSDQGRVGTNITAHVDAATGSSPGWHSTSTVCPKSGRRTSAAAWGRGLGAGTGWLPILVRGAGFGAAALVWYWLGRALSVWVAPLLVPDAASTLLGLDAVDGHFWQFQLFNVLGIAFVVVSLVPLVRRKGGAMAETDLIQRVATEASIWCQGLIYACHCGVRAGWGAEAATMTL